jgi:hypothetical protein
MATPKKPRGVANHNPGNLEKSKDKWQGLAPKQTDKRFFQFIEPVYGIRALARTLITYQDKYSLNTVSKIIKRWAPPNENDTAAYVAIVANRMGVGPNSAINVHDFKHLRPMVEAIIQHENGTQPYSPAQIDKALALAGVEPPKQPVAKTATVKASTAGISGLGVGGVATTVAALGPAVPVLRDTADTIKEYGLWLVGLGIIGAICLFGFIAYRRWDDARRLAR